MTKRNTIRKPTQSTISSWIERINLLQDDIAEYGLPVGKPLEEAYYALGEAVERLREVK